MSLDINTGTIVGRLAADPELRTLPTGTELCELRVAVNHGQTNSDGSEKPAYFFDVKVWGKQAGPCAQYLSKGKQVGVIYQLRQETWQAEDGGNRSKVVLNARQVQFLTPKGETATVNVAQNAELAPTVGDDDIPF